MGLRRVLFGTGLGIASLAAVFAFQRPFHQFPGVEYEEFEVPPDWRQPGEWAFARLMYPPGRTMATRAVSMATGGKACRSGPRIIRAPTAIFPRRCGG